jgi:hypothetical protein
MPIRTASRPIDLRPTRSVVGVIGQWKPARDARVIAELAPALAKRGYTIEIHGRGWPQVDGVRVYDRFVREDELDELLASFACVVLPYSHYFQSDVAVRALENGVPLVGRRHAFVEDLFGRAWPGLAEDGAIESWVDAVERAAAVPRPKLLDRMRDYRATCLAEWARFLEPRREQREAV